MSSNLLGRYVSVLNGKNRIRVSMEEVARSPEDAKIVLNQLTAQLRNFTSGKFETWEILEDMRVHGQLLLDSALKIERLREPAFLVLKSERRVQEFPDVFLEVEVEIHRIFSEDGKRVTVPDRVLPLSAEEVKVLREVLDAALYLEVDGDNWLQGSEYHVVESVLRKMGEEQELASQRLER